MSIKQTKKSSFQIYNEKSSEKNITEMHEMMKMGKFCDVTIQTENQQFPAHRVVLAVASPFFDKLFSSQPQGKVFVLQEIDNSAMGSLIDFCYSGKIEVDFKNFARILQGADILELKEVVNLCCSFLAARLNANNVVTVRICANYLKCDPLRLIADNFIWKNFRKCLLTDWFGRLDWDCLVNIIKRDELMVTKEEEVYEAVINWVKLLPEKRIAVFPRVLGHVRLTRLAPEYLFDVVSTEPLISISPECQQMVKEAYQYLLVSSRRHLLQHINNQPRRSPILNNYQDENSNLSDQAEQDKSTDSSDNITTSTEARTFNYSDPEQLYHNQSTHLLDV